MPFSAQKMHFFEKKGNLTLCTARDSANIKEIFFWEVILHKFFKQKKLSTFEQKCPGHFDSPQFSPKIAIFGGFEKKRFQK